MSLPCIFFHEPLHHVAIGFPKRPTLWLIGAMIVFTAVNIAATLYRWFLWRKMTFAQRMREKYGVQGDDDDEN